ncbi:MAG TPA: hypothetical protein PLN93_04815 [Vicinamibacterales bacterium]|nr:hypothetical protein [Vicinamibacterales bacterium]HOQ60998.1 hypothetical protein [Vicinamibacterales bacterium]HPK71241.1 hypothetical protein [Vicinamibacterales bacterium]
MPEVRVGDTPARVLMASESRLSVEVPAGLARGRYEVQVDGVEGAASLDVGAPLVTGVHQVDSPAFGPDGTLYVTFSGTRGQRVPVSVFRVGPDGEKAPFLTGIANATSMAFDAGGALHVTSRLDGCVYRADETGRLEVVARELGTACGIAFGSDGTMFVGDRSGTVFRIGSASRVVPFASLPPSLAAFHLAAGPADELFVTAPTMATRDGVYRIDRQGVVVKVADGFGRPQGMAVDAEGALYVVDAVAGGAGLYRLRSGARRELVLAAPALVGAAFDPRGGLVVASNDTVYRLDVALRPWSFA